MNLLKRSRYKSYDEFDFSRSPVWVQLHNIPLKALCLENAITIGRHVGEVLIVEDPYYNDRYLRNFLRVRIMLDLKKSLAYGFWLPRPDGRSIWIAVKYEKLQTFCYNCGKIGHDNRVCQTVKLMSCFKENEPRYGAWIATTTCQSWEETLSVLTTEEAESAYVSRKKEETLGRKKEGTRSTHQKNEAEEEDIFSINVIHPTVGGQYKGLRDEWTSGKMRTAESSLPVDQEVLDDKCDALLINSQERRSGGLDGRDNHNQESGELKEMERAKAEFMP
ncbi:hypothetical protein K1719_019757 [Acacia pycnantha]|nr:hypothetical protein K1719_019757 [Acacia pycnantha]